MRLQENFYYFPDAFVSLFVLMTTENWPDVLFLNFCAHGYETACAGDCTH